MNRSEHVSKRGLVVALILLCLSAASLALEGRQTQPGPVNRIVQGLTSPLSSVINHTSSSIRQTWGKYVALTAVYEENQRLEIEVSRLKSDVASLAALQRENTRLSTLLEIAETRKDLRLRVARVHRRLRSRHYRVVSIELHNADGVEPGMPVLAEGGLVGQIRSTDGANATVLLTTDPRSAVDVVFEKSRVRGIAVGGGDTQRYLMKLRYLDRPAKLADDELILTTGDDGRFPAGLVLGRSKKAAGGMSASDEIQIESAINFDDVEMVYVVLGTTGLTPKGDRYVSELK